MNPARTSQQLFAQDAKLMIRRITAALLGIAVPVVLLALIDWPRPSLLPLQQAVLRICGSGEVSEQDSLRPKLGLCPSLLVGVPL